MIRYLYIFLLFCFFGYGYFYVQYKKTEIKVDEHYVHNEKFVSIKEGKFNLNGKPFYLMALNFVATLRMDDTMMWPSVYSGYVPQYDYHKTNRDSCLNELSAALVLVHDMGFNTVRITSFAEAEVQDKITGRICFKADYGSQSDKRFTLDSEEKYRQYFKATEDLLNIINDAGLKAILVLKVFPESVQTEDHLKRITSHFKNNPTILAYDFFNEPLYFDEKQRRKEDVYLISHRWHKIVQANAPDQLCTIGLAGQREVFEWDPNIVDVDFISFHPYDYEPDQVRNEMYWYKKYVKKPWIIGETGVPSNNDSIPYQTQVDFANKTMVQNLNCGAMGYSWWQYKDVEWGGYHQNYLGILNNIGVTVNSRGQKVVGTEKPIVNAFKSFNSNQVKGECSCLKNYYNFSSNSYFRIVGKLIDTDGNPIDGAGILAWDEWWVHHYFTTSKADGNFAIYSDFKFYHWMISPTNYEMVRDDIKPDTAKLVDGVLTLNLGTLTIKKLELNRFN